MDNWDPKAEEAYGRLLAPIMNEIADDVKAKLPPGTDFGVIFFAPSSVPNTEGRVMAITTDRQRMAVYASQWALTVLGAAEPTTCQHRMRFHNYTQPSRWSEGVCGEPLPCVLHAKPESPRG